jgi:hypothetical protein
MARVERADASNLQQSLSYLRGLQIVKVPIILEEVELKVFLIGKESLA